MQGATKACYTGAEGTQDVGACKAGTQTCLPDGSGFGECMGEVVPTSETCDTPEDDDCNGMANEGGVGCNCMPGETKVCYNGPAGTQANLPCKQGTQTCNPDGMGFGPCTGEVLPGTEDCATSVDEDCDASEPENSGVDLGGVCACVPGTMAACYTGPAGTQNVGVCKGGMAMCDATGESLGPCVGEVTPKPEDCTTKNIDENCDNSLGELCPGETRWSKRGGNATNQEANGVAVDANGNVIIVGGFEGTIDLGGGTLTSAGSRDIFVAKFSSAGLHLWSKAYGGADLDYAAAVAVSAAGDIVVVGTYDSASVDFGSAMVLTDQGAFDGFALKLDSGGNTVWAKVLGAIGPQQATSVAVSAGGDVFVCGTYGGTPNFGTANNLPNGGANDYFLVKLAGNTGTTTWAKGFGDATNQIVCSVAVDSGSNPIIAVQLVGTVDFGGGNLVTQGGSDVGVAKFTSAGVHTWSKRFGDGSLQEAKGIAVDSMDRVLVTGSFQGTLNFGAAMATASAGTYDAYVLRLTSAGAYDLHKVVGLASDQFGVDVAVGENNSIVVVGDFDTAINFGAGSMPVSAGADEGYVVKYDATGTYLWNRTLTTNGAQQPLGVATTGSGNVAVAGSFTTSIDLGGGAANVHNSTGGTDVFVALLQK
jgi:hypothetical protein